MKLHVGTSFCLGMAMILVACGGSSGSSTSVPTTGVLDAGQEYQRLASVLQSSARMPKVGDFKEETSFSQAYSVGALHCSYTITKDESVTAVDVDSFDLTSDDTAVLDAGMDASCPESPPHFQAHTVKTWSNQDYRNTKLKTLHQLTDLKGLAKGIAWVKQIRLASSTQETYNLDGMQVNVQHITIDFQGSNGGVLHRQYYFSLDSWFLGLIQTLYGNNTDEPVTSFVVTTYRPATL